MFFNDISINVFSYIYLDNIVIYQNWIYQKKKEYTLISGFSKSWIVVNKKSVDFYSNPMYSFKILKSASLSKLFYQKILSNLIFNLKQTQKCGSC